MNPFSWTSRVTFILCFLFWMGGVVGLIIDGNSWWPFVLMVLSVVFLLTTRVLLHRRPRSE